MRNLIDLDKAIAIIETDRSRPKEVKLTLVRPGDEEIVAESTYARLTLEQLKNFTDGLQRAYIERASAERKINPVRSDG